MSGLGHAYDCLGRSEQAIEFYQQSLKIKKQVSDRNGEANVWFNLALALEKFHQKSKAINAYRHASRLYRMMGFDMSVQDCNDAIEFLQSHLASMSFSFGFWQRITNLWQFFQLNKNVRS